MPRIIIIVNETMGKKDSLQASVRSTYIKNRQTQYSYFVNVNTCFLKRKHKEKQTSENTNEVNLRRERLHTPGKNKGIYNNFFFQHWLCICHIALEFGHVLFEA